MDAQVIADFEAELTAEGYAFETKALAASAEFAEHTHHFDAKGLIVAGEIAITVDGATTRHGVGDRFTMAAGCPHSEAIGADGVSILIGKRE